MGITNNLIYVFDHRDPHVTTRVRSSAASDVYQGQELCIYIYLYSHATMYVYICIHIHIHRTIYAVSETHLRAHETVLDLVCCLLCEKKNSMYTSSYFFALSHATSRCTVTYTVLSISYSLSCLTL